MEKGPSIYAEYWTSPFNETYHFDEHGEEMGFKDDITGYSRAAKNFANKNERGIKQFKAYDGSTFKYNTKTNEFEIISRNGKIITYFEPDRGINYFYDQFDLYGDYWN